MNPKSSRIIVPVLGIAVCLAFAGRPLFAAPASNDTVGEFEGHADIGAVKRPGSAAYDPRTERFALEGSGANMWFGADEGHFLWKRFRGDFILDARAAFVGAGVSTCAPLLI